MNLKTLNIADLQEALTAVTTLKGAWGHNMSETRPVLVRINGQTYPLTAVSASFIQGSFVLVLDGEDE